MQPFQERVVEERNDLSIKIYKLDAFINSGHIYQTLPVDEKERLQNQLKTMKIYFSILEERIKNFK